MHRLQYITAVCALDNRNNIIIIETFRTVVSTQNISNSISLIRPRAVTGCAATQNSRHVTGSGGSLPLSQDPSTGPYPEPNRFSIYHPILFLQDQS
jgi:hypothetical protein